MRHHSSVQGFAHDQHAYIGFIYVVEACRGQGLAQQLLNQLISWSQSQGVMNIYLDVYEQNKAAIKVYDKMGFQPGLMAMKLCL